MLELTDYYYYNYDFGGISIPSNLFKNYAIKSSSRINRYTSNRINATNINNDIRNCMCEIAELLYSQDKLKEKLNDSNSDIASETVGPHSKSYVNKSSLQAQRILTDDELDTRCYKICYRYFSTTGLMYRGVFE